MTEVTDMLTRLPWFTAGAAGALILLGLACGAGGSSRTPKEPARAGTVHFGVWMKTEQVAVSYPMRYEVRRQSGRGGDELLFAAKVESYDEQLRKDWDSSADDGTYAVFSRNHYAVSPGDFKTRPASAQEWEQAKRVSHSRHRMPLNAEEALLRDNKLPPAPSTHTDDGVLFRGKPYAKSGRSWGKTVALVSPSEKWLAVFSYTAKGPPPPSLIIPGFTGEAEAGNGDMFVDVYDTATGERVLAAAVPFGDNSPSMHFSDALWVEDRYFVMPSNLSLDTCLLGTMPAN